MQTPDLFVWLWVNTKVTLIFKISRFGKQYMVGHLNITGPKTYQICQSWMGLMPHVIIANEALYYSMILCDCHIQIQSNVPSNLY